MSVLPWAELEAAQHEHSHGYLKRRLRPDLKIDLFMAISRPAGQRCLLVGGPGFDAVALPRFDGSRGLRSRIVQLDHSEILEIALTSPTWNEMFDRLIDDVVDAIPAGAASQQVVGQVVSRLLRWQRFLQASPAPLGSMAQRGLFGELWLLVNHLYPIYGPPAVAAWSGPDLADQDFRFAKYSVEVKTTVADKETMVPINGERQLDGVGVARLYLFHLALAEQVRVGTSLPQLVAAARMPLSGTGWADALDDKLAATGYSDADAERYDDTTYVMREESLFLVGPGFPRLIESDLPIGISRISYSLALSACTPFEVDLHELRA